MCAKLFNATMLSSSLFRALKMSACSPAKLVHESGILYRNITVWHGQRSRPRYSGTVRFGTV